MGFDGMIAALFADPILAKDAAYLPIGASETYKIRTITKQPDTLTPFGGGHVHSETALFDVQTADIPNPAIGDQMTVAGVTYAVQSEPTADRERLVWTLNMAVVE